MTKEEWKKVADWWGTGLGCVKMEIDGHEISLYNAISKSRMIVCVEIYVDGYIKTECSKAGNEIGDRFWMRVKKPLYSPKRLKELIKAFGKRSKEAKQKYIEYNYPSWRSFSAFKRHISEKNKEIRLISCGWEENTTKSNESKD